MKTSFASVCLGLGWFWFAVLLTGCQTSTAPASAPVVVPVTPHYDAAAIRPGDDVLVRLQSIPSPEVIEDQVDDSGQITLPYLGKVEAAGFSASQLAERIERRYIEEKVFRFIDVSVNILERYVYVGGEVERRGRILWTEDLTLTKAITAAGGFSLFANENQVMLNRDEQSYPIDARRAERQPSLDIRLLPGDVIQVPRSAF